MINFTNFPWNTILQWYNTSGRKHFLWRNYNINQEDLLYRVWISEILLQQTQAERVLGFFEKIIQKFPTLSDLSKSNYDEFFPYYKGMWYYSRARNILKTAKIIHEEYNNIFPKDIKILKKFPWIGNYTSRAILAFGYGEAFLAWDTNLEKTFSRYFFGTSTRKLEETEKEIIEKSFINFINTNSENEEQKKQMVRAINNGLMDFARIIDAKNPALIDWKNYPIQQWKWFETQWVWEEKIIKEKENFPIPDAKILVILHENHKKYFSENPLQYAPFILPASLERNTREFIKKFFLNTHKLEVSVRPIHKKWMKDNEPFIAVNAQIQTGIHNFLIYKKADTTKILSELYWDK